MADCACNHFPASLGNVTFDGKVGIGIGTATPAGPLDVRPPGLNGGDAVVFSYGGSTTYTHAIQANFVGGSTSGTNMQFLVANAEGSGTPRSVMTLTSDGKVGIGIGVTPPGAPLEMQPQGTNGGDAILFSYGGGGHKHAVRANFVGGNDSLTNLQFMVSNTAGSGRNSVMTLTAAGTAVVTPQGSNGGNALVIAYAIAGYHHAIQGNFSGGNTTATNLQLLVSDATGGGGTNSVMTLTAARNVGIGTTTPQATLDVVGTTRFGGVTYTWPASPGTAGQVLSIGGSSGALSWVNQGGGPGTSFWNQAGSNLYPLDYLSALVGIGTNSPVARLDVTNADGNALFRLAATPSSGTNPRLNVRIHDAGSGQPESPPIFQFQPDGNGVQPNIALAPGGGSVAIGTNTFTPGARLNVRSLDNAAGTNISIFSAQNGTTGLGIGYQDVRQVAAGQPLFLNAGTTGMVKVGNASTGNVTLAEGGGRVGIGVSTPAERLDVNGHVRVSQDIKVSSAIYAGTGTPQRKIADGNGCYYA